MEAWIKMVGQLVLNRKSFHGVIAEAALCHRPAKAGGPSLRVQRTRPGNRGRAATHRSAAMGVIDTGDMGAV
jgi:hypothetical protein